jgi:hypothetical protein
MTIDVYLKKANFVRDSLQDETERILYAKENEIVNLNIGQIEVGMGNDGVRLSNDIMRNGKQAYTGLYTLSTQLINPRKIAGKQYDFRETGDFLNNFELYINPNLTQIEIFSTGTGAGDKAEFFRGYKNIFGLDKENQSILNYKIILPELQIFINKHL